MVTWNAQRQFAVSIAERLSSPSLPTALEYADALYVANILRFTSMKLVSLYSGIMHSMPVYRLYPATSEREAVELWWPWGRPAPLVDGGPAKAPPARKKMLDPSIIITKRPQDVVREVMDRTGINRTTAQRMTAKLRADMRSARWVKAETMLRKGATRAEVARSVRLSPSRISTMFKGQSFPSKKTLTNTQDSRGIYPHDEIGDCYEDEEQV